MWKFLPIRVELCLCSGLTEVECLSLGSYTMTTWRSARSRSTFKSTETYGDSCVLHENVHGTDFDDELSAKGFEWSEELCHKGPCADEAKRFLPWRSEKRANAPEGSCVESSAVAQVSEHRLNKKPPT